MKSEDINDFINAINRFAKLIENIEYLFISQYTVFRGADRFMRRYYHNKV